MIHVNLQPKFPSASRLETKQEPSPSSEGKNLPSLEDVEEKLDNLLDLQKRLFLSSWQQVTNKKDIGESLSSIIEKARNGENLSVLLGENYAADIAIILAFYYKDAKADNQILVDFLKLSDKKIWQEITKNPQLNIRSFLAAIAQLRVNKGEEISQSLGQDYHLYLVEALKHYLLSLREISPNDLGKLYGLIKYADSKILQAIAQDSKMFNFMFEGKPNVLERLADNASPENGIESKLKALIEYCSDVQLSFLFIATPNSLVRNITKEKLGSKFESNMIKLGLSLLTKHANEDNGLLSPELVAGLFIFFSDHNEKDIISEFLKITALVEKMLRADASKLVKVFPHLEKHDPNYKRLFNQLTSETLIEMLACNGECNDKLWVLNNENYKDRLLADETSRTSLYQRYIPNIQELGEGKDNPYYQLIMAALNSETPQQYKEKKKQFVHAWSSQQDGKKVIESVEQLIKDSHPVAKKESGAVTTPYRESYAGAGFYNCKELTPKVVEQEVVDRREFGMDVSQ